MTELPTGLLRHRVHQALDPLWEECIENGGYRESKKRFLRRNGSREAKRVARERVYCWLAEKMWLTRAECHVRCFTVDQCHEAIRLLEAVTYIEIRAWARARKLPRQRVVVMEVRA